MISAIFHKGARPPFSSFTSFKEGSMLRSLWLVLAASLVVGLLGGPAITAQTVSSTTGAINGKVTDNTIAVLPGVTVTISSPSMMGTRTTATSVDGTYRFAAVPPGDYTVAFELTGFGKVLHEGIRVG